MTPTTTNGVYLVLHLIQEMVTSASQQRCSPCTALLCHKNFSNTFSCSVSSPRLCCCLAHLQSTYQTPRLSPVISSESPTRHKATRTIIGGFYMEWGRRKDLTIFYMIFHMVAIVLFTQSCQKNKFCRTVERKLRWINPYSALCLQVINIYEGRQENIHIFSECQILEHSKLV